MVSKITIGFYCAAVECNICTVKWVAAFPACDDADRLRCPNCENRSSTPLVYIVGEEHPEYEQRCAAFKAIETRPIDRFGPHYNGEVIEIRGD